MGGGDILRGTERGRFNVLRIFALGLFFFIGAACSSENLLQLHGLAVESDPDYRAIRHGHDATLEQEIQAFGAMLPSIGIDLASSGNKYGSRVPGVDPTVTPDLSSRFNDKHVELTLTQPLYRPELARARTQAEWRNLQSKAELEFALQDLMVRLSERYFGVLRASDDLENARGEFEAFGKQLELSKERLEFGLVAITDVDEAQAGYDLARARVIEAENDLRSAHDALATITGRNHPVLATLRGDSPIDHPEPRSVDAWSAFAADQNLQLMSFRYASNAFEADVRRASAGHLPNLDLIMRRSRDSVNGGQNGPLNVDNTLFGVQMNVPLYHGGQVQSRTREARALHLASLARLERERRAILRETRESFYGISTSIARIDALRQAVRSAESAVESISQSYELNLRTSFEVLLAQRDLFRARRDLVGARYDYILGILRLKRASGALATVDLAKVNEWLETPASSQGKPASRMAMPDTLAARPVAQRPLPEKPADTDGLVLKTSASMFAPKARSSAAPASSHAPRSP